MKKLKTLFSREGAPRLLAAALLGFVMVATAYAAATTWTNGRFTGTLQVDGATTVSTTTVSGGLGVFSFGVSASSLTYAPGVAGRLYRDSSNLLYIATATAAGSLVKVGSQ